MISTTRWPLLRTLGCARLLWALYRRREPVVAAGALLLLGLHYFTLNLSTYFYPDNMLMFWCLAGVPAPANGPRRQAGAGFAGCLHNSSAVVYGGLGLFFVALARAWYRAFCNTAAGLDGVAADPARKLIRYSPDSALKWFPHRRLVAQNGKVELYKAE